MPELMFEIQDPPSKGILKIYNDRIELTKRDVNKWFNNITTKTIPLSSVTSVQIKKQVLSWRDSSPSLLLAEKNLWELAPWMPFKMKIHS